MRRALVCGAGGFIGGHLVEKLKHEGYWMRGADIKEHEFAPTAADEFLLLDLRDPQNCRAALTIDRDPLDEVYQLTADMGGWDSSISRSVRSCATTPSSTSI